MIDRLPNLRMFLQLYWNEMGDSTYGTVVDAFEVFLNDVARTAGEQATYENIRAELEVVSSRQYEDWLVSARENEKIIKMVSGRFILPSEGPLLLMTLARHLN
jgi:hypothetical protein